MNTTYAQQYYQNYYKKNKKKLDARAARYHKRHKEKHNNIMSRRRTTIKTAVIWYKESQGCIECGLTDHRLLEFDHLPERGKKLRNIGDGAGLPSMWVEIQKCEVVCANHHSIRTWNRQHEQKI